MNLKMIGFVEYLKFNYVKYFNSNKIDEHTNKNSQNILLCTPKIYMLEC